MKTKSSPKRPVLSVRLSEAELERIDAAARDLGVKRTDFARSVILQARLPKPSKPQAPKAEEDSRRAMIDGVNRASKELERTADLLEDHAGLGRLDDDAIDRAAWQLAAVDAALREALGYDRTH